MSHRFVRCPNCKLPHDAAERVCPTTGRPMPVEAGGGARSRMSELPPPERRPEPLGFDPARNRIAAAAEAEAARYSSRPATGASVPTRNFERDLIGRAVSDRYLIRGVLGEGGMGTVYEAEHIDLGRQVAIKVLNPSQAKKRVAVKRFQQEARAAGAIGHPNICEVYDLGLLDDGSPYLVMERLIGTTLATRISREGGLPFDEIAELMTQVLSGLIAAHDKGIVHRDIKPENIFLARRVGCPPIVKILDFGVSKMMPQFQGGDEQLDLTRTGMVMGTPYYMSPEQARGERNLDGRVDVYACGVMMYESIVGKRPFLAPNYNALLLSIINTVPKSLREVRPATPPAMEIVVGRMMAKACDARYPTANAALRDIQALPVAMGTGGRSKPPTRPLPPLSDEHLRTAPTTGGRVAVQKRPRAERNEGPGAMLRSRMADAQAPRQRSVQPPDRTAPSARVDHELREAEAAANRAPRVPGSDSYEIPIRITSSVLRPLTSPTGGGDGHDLIDEMPTEVFRPGFHPRPVAPTESPDETRILAPQRPQQAPQTAPPSHAQQQRPLARPTPPPAAGVPPQGIAPPGLAPVNFSGLTADDWDNETVVKKPAALTTVRHRVPSGRAAPKPFNPDETVNLNGEIGIDVDFGDETVASPPPAHPQPPPRRR